MVEHVKGTRHIDFKGSCQPYRLALRLGTEQVIQGLEGRHFACFRVLHEKDNYLKTAELSTEQNCNMIDGVPNNTPIPPTPPELDAKPLDKVKEPKERRKGRELER